jgi:hypothetical protein
MSVNPPPFPNVDRFNNLYWITSDTGGLTEAQADLLYLKFPNAQGTENLVATNINGALTAAGIASFTNAAPPTSTATQPAAGDSSTNMPTTAWVQTAVAAGGGNILPLNNQFTGTNSFGKPVTLNGATDLDRIFNNVYYQFQDKLSLATTVGQIYGSSGSLIFDNDINNGTYSFAANNAVGVQSTPLAFNTTNMSITVPTEVSVTSSATSVEALRIKDLTSNKQLTILPYSTANNYNGIVRAGDVSIVSNTVAGIDASSLAITVYATNKVGILLDGISAMIGAGGAGSGTPTSALTCSGTGATLTGALTITGQPFSTIAQPAFSDTSQKMPTTAWVQGAITSSGVKNTWNYQIFNNNTNLGGAQTAVATISVPYNINSTFSNSIRLEVSYCIFVNGANVITPSPVPISTVAPTSPNPNTITILDLYWRPSPTLQYGALVTQSTFAGVLTSQTYQHPTQGALTYTPITISTTQSGANNLIAVTINFPNIAYTAPSYLGNLVSASASIRIVNSQGATTRTTSISGGSTAGVAFFI